MIALDSIVRRNENLLATKVGEQLFMMSIEDGYYYHLDAIGGEIWDLLATPVSVEAILATLQQRFAGEAQQIKQDLLDLLAALHAEGLIAIELAASRAE